MTHNLSVVGFGSLCVFFDNESFCVFDDVICVSILLFV